MSASQQASQIYNLDAYESFIEALQEVRACLTWSLTCCCVLSFTRGGTALNGKGGEP